MLQQFPKVCFCILASRDAILEKWLKRWNPNESVLLWFTRGFMFLVILSDPVTDQMDHYTISLECELQGEFQIFWSWLHFKVHLE